MRVTGGTLRGRRVTAPRGETVRPTQDLVRQALFSSLAARVPGARFLDLFAGSGAVGLDAWSRGAAYVCWVESDARVFRVLCENVKALCGQTAAGGPEEGWRTVRSDVFRFLAGAGGEAAYDLVFADPPYDRDGGAQWAVRLLETLAQSPILAAGGLFVMEQAAVEQEAAHVAWEQVTARKYGESRLTVYRRREQAS
jgi:16S rRNA (guanine(966)-N(2))-methyltransferase RsmD